MRKGQPKPPQVKIDNYMVADSGGKVKENMYICEECGQAFEEPKKTVFRGMKEYIEPDEPEYYCPLCGSEHYEEMHRCPVCKEYHTGCEDVCDECMDRLEKEAAPFIRARAEEKAGFIADMAKGNEAVEKILEELIA